MSEDLARCIFKDGDYRAYWWGQSIGIERNCARELARFLIDMSGLNFADVRWISFVDSVRTLSINGLTIVAPTPIKIIIGLFRTYAYALGDSIYKLLNQGSNGVWIQRLWIEPWVWVVRR